MTSVWNSTQNKWIHVHVESTWELSHTTKRKRKGNEVTRKKQRHSHNWVYAEAKRCTVGNLPDVEMRVRKYETSIAKPQDWST